MKDTLIIMGSHSATRDEFDWERTDCDVWVFNEVLKNDWCERADAVFQMHVPEIWRSKNNRNDGNHYEWLKSGDTPPVYMMEAYEDVPKAVRYPIEDVQTMIENFNEQYYTSSVAYAFALGILKGYQRIEVYGVEMETQTEYFYQRVGIGFWTGIAVGRGIEVDSHMNIFRNEPMYAYEGNISIDPDYYRSRSAAQDLNIENSQAQFETMRKEYNAILADFTKTGNGPERIARMIMNMSTLASQFGGHVGAKKENERYLKLIEEDTEQTGGSLIVRQSYEQMLNAYNKAHAELAATVQAKAGAMQETFERAASEKNSTRRHTIMTKFSLMVDEFLKLSNNVGMFHGCRKENQSLMQYHDSITRAAGGDDAVDVLSGDNGTDPTTEIQEAVTVSPLEEIPLTVSYG